MSDIKDLNDSACDLKITESALQNLSHYFQNRPLTPIRIFRNSNG